MEDEPHNQTNNEQNHEINTISTFKSMLEVEDEHKNYWFLQPHNNLLLQTVDCSSTCTPNYVFQNIDYNQVEFFLTPSNPPTISSFNSLNETFDLGCGNGYSNGVLPGFCDLGSQSQIGGSNLVSDPQFSSNHLLQRVGNVRIAAVSVFRQWVCQKFLDFKLVKIAQTLGRWL
ncbi:hypothetical protein R6Q57_015442 [Mikania cordata]